MSLLVPFGLAVAATLIALLLVTLVHRPLRIWPTPGEKTWQSYVFWPLFRGLNVLCFAVAALAPGAGLGIPTPVRIMAGIACAASIAVFAYAFRMLGRDNSYGATDGLVTGGIYQWSRNPQNAMLMVVYACLGIAANATNAAVLCAAMVLVYALMVFCEEPWLIEAYGEKYRAYCRAVPRFFNIRRALGMARAG
jgi:protein-S-isoprenylcysteine O-methyltransferase Ste14